MKNLLKSHMHDGNAADLLWNDSITFACLKKKSSVQEQWLTLFITFMDYEQKLQFKDQ